MIDIDDVQKTREYYKLYVATRPLDKNPSNIISRIIPKKPNPSIREVYYDLVWKTFFGKEEVTKQEMENLLSIQ